ncbi:MAG: amylo-alpha-1,6-glucosidase, partial [Candidatus Omnitrophica bacterium]|nr:amylo-alpha-1,6-glucosidase [Candidatus Omnitrophota bacterium]
ERRPGDVVVYGTAGEAKHFGVVAEDGRVESKFNIYHVYIHPPLAVPTSYGTPHFYRRNEETSSPVVVVRTPQGDETGSVAAPLARPFDFMTYGQARAALLYLIETSRHEPAKARTLVKNYRYYFRQYQRGTGLVNARQQGLKGRIMDKQNKYTLDFDEEFLSRWLVQKRSLYRIIDDLRIDEGRVTEFMVRAAKVYAFHLGEKVSALPSGGRLYVLPGDFDLVIDIFRSFKEADAWKNETILRNFESYYWDAYFKNFGVIPTRSRQSLDRCRDMIERLVVRRETVEAAALQLKVAPARVREWVREAVWLMGYFKPIYERLEEEKSKRPVTGAYLDSVRRIMFGLQEEGRDVLERTLGEFSAIAANAEMFGRLTERSIDRMQDFLRQRFLEGKTDEAIAAAYNAGAEKKISAREVRDEIISRGLIILANHPEIKRRLIANEHVADKYVIGVIERRRIREAMAGPAADLGPVASAAEYARLRKILFGRFLDEYSSTPEHRLQERRALAEKIIPHLVSADGQMLAYHEITALAGITNQRYLRVLTDEIIEGLAYSPALSGTAGVEPKTYEVMIFNADAELVALADMMPTRWIERYADGVIVKSLQGKDRVLLLGQALWIPKTARDGVLLAAVKEGRMVEHRFAAKFTHSAVKKLIAEHGIGKAGKTKKAAACVPGRDPVMRVRPRPQPGRGGVSSSDEGKPQSVESRQPVQAPQTRAAGPRFADKAAFLRYVAAALKGKSWKRLREQDLNLLLRKIHSLAANFYQNNDFAKVFAVVSQAFPGRSLMAIATDPQSLARCNALLKEHGLDVWRLDVLPGNAIHSATAQLSAARPGLDELLAPVEAWLNEVRTNPNALQGIKVRPGNVRFGRTPLREDDDFLEDEGEGVPEEDEADDDFSSPAVSARNSQPAVHSNDMSLQSDLEPFVTIKSNDARISRASELFISSPVRAGPEAEFFFRTLSARLKETACPFIYFDNNIGLTIVAGIPFFDPRAGAPYCNWGRDTMISLPALTLSTGHPEMFRQIFKNYIRFVKDGLMPNFIGDGRNPRYNSVDATFWMFRALRIYLKETRDYAFLDTRVQRKTGQGPETILQIISGVVDALVNGIACEDRCGNRVQTVRVRMDADGLITAGDENMNLTWMDAQPEDGSGKPTTSRHGKAVEINALWHDALVMMADILEQRGDAQKAGAYRSLSARVHQSFQRFWNSEKQCLYDVIDGDPLQAAQVRPNQVFGLHLLDPDKARRALQTVRDELLTPFGLRTLSPKDPAYRHEHRDEDYIRSYHQGTIWPWLMMGFVQAAVYAYGREETQ